MSASFYDLMKYAHTGLATADMTAFDKLRAQEMAGGGTIKTLTGVPPLSFRANGNPLISWSMLGNGQQNGTPAPDAPIMPELVGDRTRNLFDERIENAIITSGGVIESNAAYDLTVIPVIAGEQYTFAYKQDYSQNYVVAYYTTKPVVGSTSYDSSRIVYYYSDTPKVTITVPNGVTYIAIRLPSNGNLMFNLGSTPLPYEPYGYKIPITNAGQTTPIYLGQTQTVRRIKKLVLTGEEDWALEFDDHFYTNNQITGAKYAMLVACTHQQSIMAHYEASTRENVYISSSGRLNFTTQTITHTIEAFTDWLKSQYAAGTPVVIWYVLATPTTGIVNEPLAKILTYADELHSTDTEVSIPTAKGANTLTVDTELQPSSMTIIYR